MARNGTRRLVPQLGQTNLIFEGDNLDVLAALPDECARLVYLDPPFNTGLKRQRRTVTAIPSADGTPGFGGRRYSRREVVGPSYADECRNLVRKSGKYNYE